jgi:hypothetical protein
MKRWIPLLAGLLVVQAALAVALEWRTDRLAPQRVDAKLVAADLKDIDRLSIAGPASPDAAASAAAPVSLDLVKQGGRWRIPGYFDTPADAPKIEALVERVAKLQRGLPIATTSGALDRFEVADHRYERRIAFDAGGKTLATLYIGSAAGPRKSDARTDRDQAVYAVELSAYDVPTGGSEWLDTGLYEPGAKQLAGIAVTAAGKPAITLTRKSAPASAASGAATWQAQGLPAGASLDKTRADALAAAIANLKVDSILGKSAVPDWQQDAPELTLTVTDAQGKAVTWTLSKRKSGDTHVLKASDQPWYAELQPYHAQPLLDAAAPDRLVMVPAVAAASAPPAATRAGSSRQALAARPATSSR